MLFLGTFLQHTSLTSPLIMRWHISLVTSFKDILPNSFLTTQLITFRERSRLFYSQQKPPKSICQAIFENLPINCLILNGLPIFSQSLTTVFSRK